MKNANAVPAKGGVILVANHVSYIDAIMIAGASRRPIKYVMDAGIYFKAPFLFKALGAIPIATKLARPKMYQAAMKEISDTFAAGGAVCIFPEGMITRDGELNDFKPGVLRILAQNPVPVVPISIVGMWGSYFSFRWGNGLRKIPRRFRARIEIEFHDPLPATASLADMREAISSRL